MDMNSFSFINSKPKVTTIRTAEAPDFDGSLDKVVNYFGETYYSVWFVNYVTDEEELEDFDTLDEAEQYFEHLEKLFEKMC